jgi:hypothetical protein
MQEAEDLSAASCDSYTVCNATYVCACQVLPLLQALPHKVPLWQALRVADHDGAPDVVYGRLQGCCCEWLLLLHMVLQESASHGRHIGYVAALSK